MKSLLFSLALLVGLGALSEASAQTALRIGDVKIDKVQPAVVKTPEYSITGGQNKRYRIGEWLEVETEFTTVPEMIDELTFVYKILINGKLLMGEVSHINIPKGREHYSVAYIAPRSLEALMGGKALTAAAIQGIWVDVTKAGQVLGTQSSVRTPVPNVPQVQGLVLNKAQTPFSLLYWDRYEALKPAGR